MEAHALSRQVAIERIVALESDIRAPGVDRLALFGSVLRNEARSDSDVDVLVWFTPGRKTFDSFMELAELLEAHLGHRVERVTRESLSPFFDPRIMAEASDVIRHRGPSPR